MSVYLYIRIKDLHNNKLPASLSVANSWLVSWKVGQYCYPFYSQMQLLMIISFVSVSFSDILFSSQSIQMVSFFSAFVYYYCSLTISVFFLLLSLSLLFLRVDNSYQFHIDLTVLYRTNIFAIGITRSLLFSCSRQTNDYRSSDSQTNENLFMLEDKLRTNTHVNTYWYFLR